MKGSITADRIANSIVQRRKKYDNFILVEGSHDRLFFLKFKNDNTQVEISFGWEKLIEIVDKLKERGFDKFIGVIDRDFRDIIPDNLQFAEEIIITDTHDINILCLEKSFDTIFNTYSSEDKVDTFTQNKKCNCIKEYTHKLTKPLSHLKLINKREGLHLSFKSNDNHKKRLDYTKFIDKNKYEIISNQKIVETITNFSRSKTSQKIQSDQIIVEKLEKSLNEDNLDFVKLNNGHDFGEIICVGLKKALATQEVKSEDFLKECILNFESKDFIRTNMFSEIKKVEKNKNCEFLKI